MRLYWVARVDLAKAGYRPKTVPLRYDWNDPAQHGLISAACLKFQAEMLEWSAARGEVRKTFNGTIADLIRRYQTDEASPYRRIKWNTARTYDQVLRGLEQAVGARSLARLGLDDFRRWYDSARKPKSPGNSERLRKAHGVISMLRRIIAYGVAAELPECSRLATILHATEFEAPAPRREKLTAAHVESFAAAAIAAERLSLALGTAIQFETTLRQRDVIGEWVPIPAGKTASGIMLGGRRWTNGLTWSDLGDKFELYKRTTKTGAIAAHDLKLCPLTMKIIAMVAPDRRVGPLIVDETAGRPYAEHAYAREWRVIAEAAGVPKGVWNMDARAGGISEADDAGADLDDIRSQAAHSQVSTTARYVRGTIGKSRKVAKLRAAHRAERKPND
jgi:hypothetical protein